MAKIECKNLCVCVSVESGSVMPFPLTVFLFIFFLKLYKRYWQTAVFSIDKNACLDDVIIKTHWWHTDCATLIFWESTFSISLCNLINQKSFPATLHELIFIRCLPPVTGHGHVTEPRAGWWSGRRAGERRGGGRGRRPGLAVAEPQPRAARLAAARAHHAAHAWSYQGMLQKLYFTFMNVNFNQMYECRRGESSN